MSPLLRDKDSPLRSGEGAYGWKELDTARAAP
jgi:hypothetical protein